MNKIKEIRSRLGLSVYKLAKMTDLTPSYISNLENGQRTNPSKETMEKISEALGQSVIKIFFPDEIENKGVF